MKKVFKIFMLICLMFTIVGCNNSSDDENPDLPLEDNIKLTKSSSDFEGCLYDDVTDELKSMGFINIKYEIIYDLVTGWLVSDGEIEEVSIAGDTSFRKGDKYNKNCEIIISYHTFESNKPKDPVTPSEDFSKDTYDDSYTGKKYRVNVIVEFNPNIFLDIYDVNLRIDGRVFETLKHGVNGDYEYDLKPGKHTIAFTKIDDTTVYGYGTIDVQSDMSVNYYIKGHEESIDCEERSINLNAYYTITLDSNGGQSMDAKKVKAGEKLINPGRPVGMEDYQFCGWSEDGINPIEYPYYVNSNVTLKALWEEKPNLVFEQCWEVEFSSYSLYVLIDEDTNTVIWVGTNDTYVAQGKIISGDLSSGLVIEYTRKGKTWNATLKHSNSIAVAKYIDSTGNTTGNTYYLQVDSEEAEKYLDKIDYDYKNFE